MVEDSLWKLQGDFKQIDISNKELETQIEEMTKEMSRVKDSKDKADKNVDELKEKLRLMIRE